MLLFADSKFRFDYQLQFSVAHYLCLRVEKKPVDVKSCPLVIHCCLYHPGGILVDH